MINVLLSCLNTRIRSFCLVAGTLFLFGCGSESNPIAPADPGLLISHELITTYESQDFERVKSIVLDSFFIGAQMNASDFRGKLVSTFGKVSMYRVAYETMIPELGNQKVIAYGLVAIPEGATNGTPILSYQHGTTFTKEEAPSNFQRHMETKLALLQFASQGYIVVAADYIGNGPLSPQPNTFFVKGALEQAMFDMHTASLAFLKKMSITPGKLFLLGWSQGGYNTLLHFRKLERSNVPVAGVATASGPGDPVRGVMRSLFARRDFDATYLAAATTNMMFAIEHYNKLANCSSLFIKPGKYQIAKNFYDFKASLEDYFRDGGYSIDSVFTPEFFSTAKTASHPFWQVFSQAECYRWLSKAPLRQYYSSRDDVVPADLGKHVVDYQTSIGKTNATSHDAGPNADHRCVYVHTLIDAKAWFDSLK
jgi:pimeloyl-ACP methyl ester carboxylesterase